MRKSRKTIAILAIIAMVLMMLPVQAFADTTSATTRLSGTTRVDTAIAIANNGWANGATNVVVVPANDANLVDALAVAPLAKQLNAPVLITDKASLDASVSAEIATLKATTVYAVGALSDTVVSQLKALSGVTVTQVKGADRFATAAQIASMLTSPAGSVVVGYNGLADALSAASYAAANGYAILVANTDGTVPSNEAAYEGSKVIVLGGPTLVADIAGATRYYGADRYATNDEVIKNLSFQYDKVYVANGETLVDALPGAVLAALSGSPIVLANTQGAAAAADVFKNLTASSQVIPFGGAAVVPDSVVTSIQTGSTTPVSGGPVTVQGVKAVAANAIQVTFTNAPADTSKVTFAVDLSGTAVTVTPTWNDSNTQATLTGSANFAPGTYNVGVKNDTTDLGSNTVTFTQQAISQINITSKVFAVTTLIGGDSNQAIHNNDGVADGSGFITYTVTDQYGNDITNSALANGITWTPGISQDYVAKNGVITVAPPSNGSGGTMSFNQYTSMSITGYDSSTGISTSATLPISNTGPLSGITLEKLTSPNNDDLNANNTTGQWYIDYTALDASGNPTKNLKMVNEGILNNSNINGGGFLDVKVVADPNDSTQAAISVTLSGTSTPPATDMQIPITVVTTNGKSSTLNVTLKKAANQVDSIILGAPAQMVASDDTIDIPFTATDPTGKVMTSYSDLLASKNVTITASSGDVTSTSTTSGAIYFVRNSDGTAAIEYTAPNVPQTATGPTTVYLSATVTTTGKFSQLTISVQKQAKADSLNAQTIQFLQAGAAEYVDFGYNWGGLTLNDQYGRAMDMNNEDTVSGILKDTSKAPNGYYYYVNATASSSSGSSVTVDPRGDGVYTNAFDGHWITLYANSPGSTTVNYEVWQAPVGSDPNPSTTSGATNIDTGIGKTVTYTVVKDSDITGYTLDAVSNPLYMLQDKEISDAVHDYYKNADGTDSHDGFTYSSAFNYDNTTIPKTGVYGYEYGENRPQEYAANPWVWGKTSGGAQVMLAPSTIKAVSIDSSKFYLLDPTKDISGTDIVGRPSSTTVQDPGVNNFVVYAHDITEAVGGGSVATTDTSASTNLTVTVLDSSGNYVNVTQPIKSVTDGKTVQKITFPGVFNGVDGNRGMKKRGNSTVVINLQENSGTFARLQGKRVTRWDSTGNSPATSDGLGSRAVINLRAADQFGTLGGDIPLVNTNPDGQSFAGGYHAWVDPATNILHIGTGTSASNPGIDLTNSDNIQDGDYFTLTGSAPNGTMGTVKIVFQK